MKKTKGIISNKGLLILLSFYTLIIVGYGFVVFFVFRDSRLELSQAGLFGDMFGAVNAFFTGLAFLGVAVTLYFQMRETENFKNQKVFEENNKYLIALKTTKTEIDFYTSKIEQLSSEIKVIIDQLNSNKLYLVPSYSLYPKFLERCKIELNSFHKSTQIVQNLGNCHFELCHILERLNLYKQELSEGDRTRAILNGNGFHRLLVSNISTFKNFSEQLENEIAGISNVISN